MGCCATKKGPKEAKQVEEADINARVEEIFLKHDPKGRGYFTKDEFKAILRDILQQGGTPVREEYL